jgi:cytochrome c oxidase subunit 2
MRLQRAQVVRLVAALLFIGALLLLSGCGAFSSDQNTFAPEGDVADKQRDLFLLVMWPALIIMVLVGAALVYVLVRYRRRKADELPHQLHGNTRLEVAWTVAPTLLLLGLAVPTIMGIVDINRDPKDDALPVRVVGFQWDWRFEYLDPTTMDAEEGPAVLFRSDEFHVPVDQEIGVYLESLDVIHSFWVPKLAGKLDLIPGRTNRMWFNAREPGVYSAQCAEFCGIGHPVMRFDVIAESQEEFDAWFAERLAAAEAEASN